VLGKPLGIGILSAALKKGELDAEGYRQMLETTTRLNTAGPDLADLEGVDALTDVTGFGLLGHLLEICRGSRLSAEIHFDDVPVLPAALEAARHGYATGASSRNWASYRGEVELPGGFAEWKHKLLTDPQTSGGLLVACAPEATESVLGVFRRHHFADAKVFGVLAEGRVQVAVR
jgi:selenide,water dikinase